VSFLNGFKIDLPTVAKTVRSLSPALISVDVTQAFCHIPMDLRDADLVVSSTHKWLLASHGGGVVAVPAKSSNAFTVPAGGWFNLEEPFAPERFEQPARPKTGAAGFTVGMPNYPAVYAIAAAAEYILETGVDQIDKHVRPLTEFVLAELKNLPQLRLLTPVHDASALAGIIAFQHPHAEALHRHLRAADVHVMHNAGRLRASIHGYNTMADVEAFIRALHAGLKHV